MVYLNLWKNIKAEFQYTMNSDKISHTVFLISISLACV